MINHQISTINVRLKQNKKKTQKNPYNIPDIVKYEMNMYLNF